MLSKKRYEINKGKKNFDVRVIEPTKYKNELYLITVDAYSGWYEKYRPTMDEVKFCDGSGSKENDTLSGYTYLTKKK